ncbi:MAG TPA: hypothetical protein VFR90_12300 [Methylibium sp.]|uniref:hypothetical protein n=1 Tax=Methylibium sp. TaxID=2067992 RepID=UPI002DBF544E|nr:hypothetical protein [Methylibium sp.]HEU4459897.1 hypothetical protein [Methylibium sp.]
MNRLDRISMLAAALAATGTLAGCQSFGGSKSGAATAPAASPAPAAAAPAAPKVGPGMNERGEVVDPKKVEAGYGQKVKGLEDWEGEITGKPAPGSKFGQLKIGMPMAQVTNLLGQPTDQGAHMTGKAWIPFYFGSDRYRYELVYKGQGRLIFAGPAGFSFGQGNLTWIIHSANEQGYR